MRKRYPRTLASLGIVLFFGTVLGIATLWHPFAYIVLGGIVLSLLAMSVRDDRKHER